MNFPTINYTITNAELGLRHIRPEARIRQPQADLEITQPQADLQIKVTPSKLNIDQSEAFADMDYKGPLRRTREWVEKALQEYNSNVSRTAQQGDQMMRIENGGGAIPRIAKENGEPPLKEQGLGYLPKDRFRVKIDYQPAELEVKVTPREPIINSRMNKPIIDIPRWQVNHYMKQMPSVEFETVGQQVDIKK